MNGPNTIISPPPRFLDHRNRLWFISPNQTVRLDRETWESVEHFPAQYAIDRQGIVWAWETGTIQNWADDQPSVFHEYETGIVSIQGVISDAQNRVWIYGIDENEENGLAYFDGTDWTPVSIPELQIGQFYQCEPDPSSGIWCLIGDNENGNLSLIKIEQQTAIDARHFEPGTRIFDNPFFRVDKRGDLWLYARFGIHHLPLSHASPDRSNAWSRIEPLPGRYFFAGLESEEGLWFSAKGSIGGRGGLIRILESRVETYESNVRQFGSRGTDGTLYFGGDGELYRISPRTNSKPDRIHFPRLGVAVSAEKDSIGNLWVGLQNGVLRFRSDGIPPETALDNFEKELHVSQNLRTRFYARERFQPRDIRKEYRYSWRIDAEPWSEFNSISSLNIPLRSHKNGEHVLQVRAMDEGLEIDPTPAEAVFFIHPIPIQDRLAFKVALILIFSSILLLALLALGARRKLKLNLLNLETIVNERTNALRNNEERLRGLIETSSDWIWETDRHWKYTYVSAKVRDILGYQPWEIVGKSIFFLISPQEFDRDAPIEEEFLHSDKPFRCIEKRYCHKDGHDVILESSGTPIFDDEKTFLGFRGIDRDITDRKNAENAKKELEEQLYQSQKMEAIGQLAGGMAHDFNNLLTVIVGNIELSLLRAVDPIRSYLMNTKSATDRAANLVKQLLTFSRKSQVELRAISLNDLVLETHQLVRETIDRRIEIEILTDPDLPLIRADKSQISSVLMNFCINARDAIFDVMQGKSALPRQNDHFIIEINTGTRIIDSLYCQKYTYAKEGLYVVLSIFDNGIGMSGEIMRRVFEPFFTTKDPGKGTGLGLANAYGIINQHGGWITVESTPDEGSLFSIFLPVSQSIHEDEDEMDSIEDLQGGSETILLIDDEEQIRSLGESILTDWGYRVLLAADGREGVDLFLLHPQSIDLIIIDYSMPRLSGAEALVKIFAVAPHQKVIVSSGYVDEWKAKSFESLGVSGFLDKPYRRGQMLRKVREILDT